MHDPLERRTQRSSAKNKNLDTLEHNKARSSAKTQELSTSARARKPVRLSIDFHLPELIPRKYYPLERHQTRSSATARA